MPVTNFSDPEDTVLDEPDFNMPTGVNAIAIAADAAPEPIKPAFTTETTFAVLVPEPLKRLAIAEATAADAEPEPLNAAVTVGITFAVALPSPVKFAETE